MKPSLIFFLFLTSTISSLKSTEECSVELCFVWHALHETVCMESFKWKWFFVWICPFRIADECQLHETASPTQKEFVLNLLSFLELTSTIYMRELIRLVKTQKLFLLINNRKTNYTTMTTLQNNYDKLKNLINN